MEKHNKVQGQVARQLHEYLDKKIYTTEICQLIVGFKKAVTVRYNEGLNCFVVADINPKGLQQFASKLGTLISQIDEKQAEKVALSAAHHYIGYCGAECFTDMKALDAVQMICEALKR